MTIAPKTIRLHRRQAEFRRCTALYRGFVGGRGAGKSWVGAYDLIRRAKRGRTYMVASPTYTMLEDTTMPTFRAIAQELGVWGGVKMTPRPNVALTTGATVRFRSAEDPDKMRGPNLTGCWLDEASQMVEDAYTIAIGCLREGGEQGWLSATFTPNGLGHWTYDVFGRGKPDTVLVRAHTRDNPFNPEGFAETLLHQYGPTLGRQELGGEFLNIDGAEWPGEWFERPGIWFDEWPKDLTIRTIALDPSKGRDSKHGDYQALVKLGRAPDGVLYCEADMSRTRHCVQLVQDGIEISREFWPDGFAVETNQFQELLAQDFARESMRLGVMLPLHEVINTVNKQVRIRRLTPYLSRGVMRFKANSRGTQTLVEQLRDFPVHDHDDGPDALEMALRLMIEIANERWEQGRIR